MMMMVAMVMLMTKKFSGFWHLLLFLSTVAVVWAYIIAAVVCPYVTFVTLYDVVYRVVSVGV